MSRERGLKSEGQGTGGQSISIVKARLGLTTKRKGSNINNVVLGGYDLDPMIVRMSEYGENSVGVQSTTL